MENLEEKFKIMKFFDDARWQNKNYYELNYCKRYIENKNDSKEVLNKKMLLHWITYIAERGSDYRPIWDKGGYVYSYYLTEYFSGKSLREIFKPNGDYLKKYEKKDEKEKYKWYAKIENDEKDSDTYNRLKKWLSTEEKDNNEAYYISRYNVDDYINAVLTLSVLKELQSNDFKYSFLQYIKDFADLSSRIYDKKKQELQTSKISKEEFIIKGIALALYCLTYDELNIDSSKTLGKYNFKGISKVKNIKECYTKLFENEELLERHNFNLKQLKEDDNLFFDAYYKFYMQKKHQFYNMKRVWCALRDYLKVEFEDDYFKVDFTKYVFEDIKDITISRMVKYLELPGDVWNNNSIFSNCVFNMKNEDKNEWEKYNKFIYKNKNENNRKYTLNRLLRFYIETEEKIENENFSPEQFDCTFNFVPKMCDSANNHCSFCPFAKFAKQDGKEKFDTEKFEKFCIGKKGKNCTIAMICCGYQTECKGETVCKLRKILGLNE